MSTFQFPVSASMQGKALEKTTAVEAVWVFGYGSLLWKTNFPYQDKVVGCVKGYTRKFWQGSFKHRGTHSTPGRVVTLIPSSNDYTWGIAYKVNPDDIPEVMAYLDNREYGGYTTHRVLFHPKKKENLMSGPFDVLVYIGTETNPGYLGPASSEDLSRQIMSSRGISGCNSVYVLTLAKIMREIAPMVEDEHLFGLEQEIREKLKQKQLESKATNDVNDDSLLVVKTDGLYCGVCTACSRMSVP